MIRRKELVNQIKVMKDAQRIIKRDPDLMQIMNISINDSEIAGTELPISNANEKNAVTNNTIKPNAVQPQNMTQQPTNQVQSVKQKNFGSLFGTGTKK